MMPENPGLLLTVFAFVLMIGPLVFIHELGHYLAGRLCGVKADVFSIGFGRELAGWTDSRGTRWKLCALPLGGYVKFAGDMNAGSQPDPAWLALPPAERAKTFQSKAVWQKMIIVAAGPAANFLLAIGVIGTFTAIYGEQRTPAIVAGVAPGSPAEAAGLKAGDRIERIAGRDVDRFEDVSDIVRIRPGQPLDIVVRRGAKQLNLEATPAADVLRDRFGNEARIGLLGIAASGREIVPVPLYRIPYSAVRQTADVIDGMTVTLVQFITGQRSVKEMAGPVGMARIAGQRATMGWMAFVDLMVLISINLGFINLLPVPMLDGGHLVFYAIEAVMGRPVDRKVQEWAFRSGLAMLLALMMFVTLNDLSAIGLWQGIAGLIARG